MEKTSISGVKNNIQQHNTNTTSATLRNWN